MKFLGIIFTIFIIPSIFLLDPCQAQPQTQLNYDLFFVSKAYALQRGQKILALKVYLWRQEKLLRRLLVRSIYEPPSVKEELKILRRVHFVPRFRLGIGKGFELVCDDLMFFKMKWCFVRQSDFAISVGPRLCIFPFIEAGATLNVTKVLGDLSVSLNFEMFSSAFDAERKEGFLDDDIFTLINLGVDLAVSDFFWIIGEARFIQVSSRYPERVCKEYSVVGAFFLKLTKRIAVKIGFQAPYTRGKWNQISNKIFFPSFLSEVNYRLD
jgi:hypothetical protein